MKFSRKENAKGTHMKRTLLFLVVAAASVLSTQVNVYAHHSFAATYFEDQTVTIKGKLVQFLYRNPHSFVHVEAPDDKGEDADLGCGMGRGRPVEPRRRHA